MNWSFWFELLVRSAVLLIAGEALRTFSKAQSAAFRHALLLWVFALLSLLPLLSVFFPEIRIPLWTTAHTPRDLVTIQEVSSTAVQRSTLHAMNWPFVFWLAGALVVSAPLLVGTISVSKMARRGAPLTNPALQEAFHKLSSLVPSKIEILVCSELSVPLTCGFLRPRILLPATAEHWSFSRLNAVLLHELAHVRRRDVAAQVAAHLIAALWWFQPLVWMLRRTVRTESEFACDAEALRSGFRPSEYAAELLAVAQTMGRYRRLPSSAISMAQSHALEERLRAILNPPVALLSPLRTYALALALGATAIAASAVSLRPNQTLNESSLNEPALNEQGGSTMKRTILSALLTAAGLSAATVSGSIYDPSGNAVPDVKVLIYNPDTGAKQEAVTGSDGKFSLDGAVAGQCILRAEKPGFTSIFREFDLKADSQMDREFTMTTEGGQQAADKVTNTNEDQPKRLHVGGRVAQANLTTKVQPVYPAAAKAAGIQGIVRIETTISKDGLPIELRVLSSPNDDLSQASVEAVRQWRYRPTLLNGAPVEVVTEVIVNYTLVK
jgi:TonB family protein